MEDRTERPWVRKFTDHDGLEWAVTAREQPTPRHHGRWFLVFVPVNEPQRSFPLGEIRWQNWDTAHRTLSTISVNELRRRLDIARSRLPLQTSVHATGAKENPTGSP